MRRDKVITNYAKIKESELAILAGKVAAQMEGNANFSNDLKPTAAELLAAAEDYRIKHEVAINGGSKHEKQLKKESKTKLLDMLSDMAHAINIEAKGNAVALSSTGLILQKQHVPVSLPGTTLRVVLRDGPVSGMMRTDFDKIPETYEYEIQIGTMDTVRQEIDWGKTLITTTSSQNYMDNLTPGTLYYVRVRGKNRLGYGNWSDAVSLIAR
ncbi:fibronectin type III domain-containing protein [Sphingobacterium faecale]|uniref:Fibronectin type III domain-containing protein n=1 Tax=Sphingobacterium faecale TaxID=2803775 RepID=A0ABS1R6M6_9SPHI|nr:fibronectin type III domain-containing protein [Sphingobacterium faecale]MBL1410357.1 fibronectin type III domain-containing protein [Sphingobacterium faecale]